MKNILIISLLLDIFVTSQLFAGNNLSISNNELKDSIAPEISLKTIYNKADNLIPTLKSLRGKVVILDFWATWCSPCVASMPELNQLSEKYKDKVQIIGITDDPKSKVDNFLSKINLNYWIAIDDSRKTFKSYSVNLYPTVIIINKEGNVVYRGHKVNSKLIEEVLTTGIIHQKKETETKKKLTPDKLYGAWSPGTDPLYSGAAFLLYDKKTIPKPISQFIIRPSLKTKKGGGGYGYNSYKGNTGITLINKTLSSIVVFLHHLSSKAWVENLSKDTVRYDIVYFQKNKSLTDAYAEIENELAKCLSIEINKISVERTVNILDKQAGSSKLVRKKDIKKGTYKLYKPISFFLSILEDITNEPYIINKTLSNMFIYYPKIDDDNFYKASKEEIISFLQKNGIAVKKEKRKIDIFKIKDK